MEKVMNMELGRLRQRVDSLRRVTGGSKSCGWMFDEIAFMIYCLVKFYQPHLVVQTGHLWGKSATVILEAMNDGFLTLTPIESEPQNGDRSFTAFVRSHRPELAMGRLISIDPQPIDVPNPEKGIETLKSWYGNFEFHSTTSQDFFQKHLERLKKEYSRKRIMVIIDGDHSPKGCYADLRYSHELGADLVVIDDTMWLPYIGSLAQTFALAHNYHLLDFDLYNGVSILYKCRKRFDSTPRLHQLIWRSLSKMIFRLPY